MKLSYFKETDTLYIELNTNASHSSSEVATGVVLDFDANNKITGIEIDNASKNFDLTKLESNLLPLELG
jgi:uncharacterized protein YuzE